MTKPTVRSIIARAALVAAALFVSSACLAEEGTGLQESGARVTNIASLQSGARTYFNYCAGCHSLKYMRYSRIAQDLQLTDEEVLKNFAPAGAKAGDLVVSNMPSKPAEGDQPAQGAEVWFGKDPPDLSLEARAKGADWIYTYLKSFYVDPSRPVGWNNTLFQNASMPFPLWELQGVQSPVYAPAKPGQDAVVEKLELTSPGKLTPAQFDDTVRDLTAFLEYASEPAALQRHAIGVWVLFYLALFTLLAYLLKHEYWKDVH
ncbi:MAG: cytochrome c1 [Proteobacteria bacterium]|nr:cytochrome c1 [Pseudomonadota bacterium]